MMSKDKSSRVAAKSQQALRSAVEFGRRLRTVMIERNWAIEDLRRRLGLEMWLMKGIVIGRDGTIDFEVIRRIVSCFCDLGFSAEWLLTGKGPGRNDQAVAAQAKLEAEAGSPRVGETEKAVALRVLAKLIDAIGGLNKRLVIPASSPACRQAGYSLR